MRLVATTAGRDYNLNKIRTNPLRECNFFSNLRHSESEYICDYENMKIYFRDNLSDIHNGFSSHHNIVVREKVHETTRMMNNNNRMNHGVLVSILTVIDSFSLESLEKFT